MNPIPRPGQRYYYNDGYQGGILELVVKGNNEYWDVKVIDSASNKIGFLGGCVLRNWTMVYGTWTYLEGQDAPT